VAAFPVLSARKTADLFKKYGVLNKAEVESRAHITVEKYVKQKTIEAETMVQMARQLIVPAALEQQRRSAATLEATEGAGVKDARLRGALQEYVTMVGSFAAAVEALDKLAAVHDDDTMKHATYIKTKVRPAMAEVRLLADQLEQLIARDVWPLPTYRDLLFLK
jgi:glutamine synthetase